MTRARSLAWSVSLLGALFLGCSSSPEPPQPPAAAPPQPPIVAPDPLPDTRQIALRPVNGATGAFPVSVKGGDLTMGGSVVGPDGEPVDGATVRLERFVGERSGTLDVRTNRRGRWVAIDVHGGRYRFRAWRAPDLAMPASDLRFVAADADVDLALRVDRYDGSDVTAEVDDGEPEVGATVTVTALATRRQVDGEGIITTAPASGRDARMVPIGPWRSGGSTDAVVDGDGRARWTLVCERPGAVSARIEALGVQTTVSATCTAERVAPTPPVAQPVVDFPIGASFTPPFAGPIPAGTYAVTDHPGTCVLTYEAWTGRGWAPARRTVTGVGEVTVPDIARSLESLGDSPACTYERRS